MKDAHKLEGEIIQTSELKCVRLSLSFLDAPILFM